LAARERRHILMKRKRHTPEEVIKKLRRADEELADGKGIEDVCRSPEISPATYHRWAKEYTGAKLDTVKQLKELQKENTRLKKLVAELAFDMAILNEVAEGKW
jgi:transposase-like protein